MKRFEYKVEKVIVGMSFTKNQEITNHSNLEKKLTSLGNDGWELIEIKENLQIAIFKREINA